MLCRLHKQAALILRSISHISILEPWLTHVEIACGWWTSSCETAACKDKAGFWARTHTIRSYQRSLEPSAAIRWLWIWTYIKHMAVKPVICKARLGWPGPTNNHLLAGTGFMFSIYGSKFSPQFGHTHQLALTYRKKATNQGWWRPTHASSSQPISHTVCYPSSFTYMSSQTLTIG